MTVLLFTIYAYIKSYVESALKWLGVENSVVSHAVTIGLIALALIIAVYILGSWAWGLIGLLVPHKKGGQTVDKEILKQQAEIERRADEKIEKAKQTVLILKEQSDARIRQADDAVKEVTKHKSKGISGRELDEMARDEK